MATLSYSATQTLTCSVASTATSSDWTAGRESNEVNNTSDVYQDVMLSGKVTVGTTPTANTYIRIFVWGATTAPSSTAIDVIDGTDSTETITSVGVRDGFMKLADEIFVNATTSDRTYPFGPVSLAECFGGNMPKYWGVFVSHNTGVNLNSTAGNHVFEWVGVKY